MSEIDGLTVAFLEHHLTFKPVDATFMGLPGHDHRLPPADAGAPGREAAELQELSLALAAAPLPADGPEWLDARMLNATLAHFRRQLAERARFHDPTWYTGETAFALIGLMLPSAVAPESAALAARLAAIPTFLADGAAHLAGRPTPRPWCDRARTEIAAVLRLLDRRITLHSLWRPDMQKAAAEAAAALLIFDQVIAHLPDADPRCGKDYLDFMMREVHGFQYGSDEAEAVAAEAFIRLEEELTATAKRLDPERSYTQQIADLHRICPEPDQLIATYRTMHEQALEAASSLLTPASDYRLDFRPLPDWAQGISGDLYFLSYRSPPAFGAGSGSVYWTGGAGQSLAFIKSTHAVHHGSIGHHTQNTRARASASRFGRVSATGAPRGIAFLSAGSLEEGWACYAQELMAEAPGFYSPAELLAMKASERRNIGSVLLDIRLHNRTWTLEQAERFYADEAGFPPERIRGEVVRNSIFPSSRLMYWLGTEMIKSARAKFPGSAKAFHDTLLANGSVAAAWSIEEIQRRAA